MPYRKKRALLAAVLALLAAAYALALFFDPQRSAGRAARFTWLPPGARDQADRIEISRSGETLELVLRNGAWFALPGPESSGPGPAEGPAENLTGPGPAVEIPVKQGRVDDLFRILGTRGSFPRRGSSASSHEDLGLGSGASRLVIRGGPGLPLLDLLVGREDPSGREVFLRKTGENEFRSGDRLIASYVNGGGTSWYDMKLFEETSPAQVQRVRVRFIGYTGAPGAPGDPPPAEYEDYAVARSGETWTVAGEAAAAETVDGWIRGILEAQGEDLIPLPGGFQPAAEITVDLGDGSSLSLAIGNAGENGGSPALVKGRPYGFTLPQWTVSRLLLRRESLRASGST